MLNFCAELFKVGLRYNPGPVSEKSDFSSKSCEIIKKIGRIIVCPQLDDRMLSKRLLNRP